MSVQCAWGTVRGHAGTSKMPLTPTLTLIGHAGTSKMLKSSQMSSMQSKSCQGTPNAQSQWEPRAAAPWLHVTTCMLLTELVSKSRRRIMRRILTDLS